MQTTNKLTHLITVPHTGGRCEVEFTNSNRSHANVLVTAPVMTPGGLDNMTFILAEIDQGYTDLWSILEIALDELQFAFTMRSFPTFSGVARYLNSHHPCSMVI